MGLTKTSLDCHSSKLTWLRALKGDGLALEAIMDMKAVLNDCLTQHAECGGPEPKPLPTRLLRLRSLDPSAPILQVNLHVNREHCQVGQYAALSYCWGGPQRQRLTRDNLKALVAGELDSCTLPQTLKDAILTTQVLGLEYLWVDALCIIQDDDVDKEFEISRMCSIYENSTVTIVAATAASVDEGFLSPNRTSFTPQFPGCEVDILLDDNGSEAGDGPCVETITLIPEHTQDTRKYPINKRGWTFQEALIPPRLLVLGGIEPFLRCRIDDKATSYPTCVVHTKHAPVRVLHPPMDYDKERRGMFLDDRFTRVWLPIVGQYAHRELSFWEDRPHAIRGVIDFLSTVGRRLSFWRVGLAPRGVSDVEGDWRPTLKTAGRPAHLVVDVRLWRG